MKKETNNLTLVTGCFDILHAGHVWLLWRAKDLGEKLIVGINSDASIKRIKGKDRPINTEWYRRFVLERIVGVDEVVCFEEDDACELIDILKPKYWVKGEEYKKKKMPEKSICKVVGTEIVYVSSFGNVSTTGILNATKKKSNK